MADESPSEAVATVKQVDSTPQGVLKRWTAELDLADQAEKTWRENSETIWNLYESKDKAANSFNILWSNTETLRPALYNSSPKPDIRRRFRDADPVGKVCANVLQRSLTYQIDAYDFDEEIKSVVLDVLLPGRGVGRVKYSPKFRDLPPAPAEAIDEADPIDMPEDVEPDQEIATETAPMEHVNWKDFRRGPGKTWKEVPWVAFRHDMPHDQLIESFGKTIADKIPLGDIEHSSKINDKEIRTLMKVAEVWEIWDKSQRKVIFICQGYKHGPLSQVDDPLELEGFLPMPRPIYAIENSQSLIPGPLYTKYEEQAKELNRTTSRINKIVAALKIRGAYSASLSEVSKIIEADDNEMLPIENASEIANMGGLDKAIWIMPIDKLAGVLTELYESRAKTLQTIYEITGLGDVMRGVSNPHETLGAQQIKTQWGSLRLQRMQREVQRFIRDALRLKAQIIAKHFQKETLMAITGIELPTPEMKQQIQMMAQQAQQMAAQPPMPPQPGAPPAPPAPPAIPPEVMEQGKKILATPTWDDIMELLKSDKMLMYRIDIETDSTIQETLTRDAQGMQEAITAVVNIFSGIGPAVQAGYLDVEVVKTLAQAMARTSRMGLSVEDAIEQMKQPPPPPPPPPDTSVQVATINSETAKAIAQGKTQAEMQKAADERAHKEQLSAYESQVEAAKTEAQQKIDQVEMLAKNQTEALKEQNKRDIEALRAQNAQALAAAQDAAKAEREAASTQLKADTAKEIELIRSAVSIITAQLSATKEPSAAEPASEAVIQKEDEAAFGRKSLMDMIQKLVDAQSGEKEHTFNYDAEGNVIGAVSKPVSK